MTGGWHPRQKSRRGARTCRRQSRSLAAARKGMRLENAASLRSALMTDAQMRHITAATFINATLKAINSAHRCPTSSSLRVKICNARNALFYREDGLNFDGICIYRRNPIDVKATGIPKVACYPKKQSAEPKARTRRAFRQAPAGLSIVRLFFLVPDAAFWKAL